MDRPGKESTELRVVWLFEYPTLNGGERSLLATLPLLKQQGIEPVALAPSAGPLAAELARSHILHLPFDLLLGDGRRISRDVARETLRTHLKSLRPALLHANSLSMGRLSGPVVREAGVPGIAHLRDIVGLSRAAVDHLNCHTRLLAVSAATRDFHVRQGVAAAQTHICYNGVDLHRFTPRPATGWLHQRLGLPGDAMLAATIGQLIMRKGQDVLVRSAAHVKDRLPALHWLVIGERHSQKAEAIGYESNLHERIADSGLSERFHFLGTIEHVERLLPELTVLVHPARQEPLGRVLLEAAAAGVPCVATDIGGTREIFPDATQARLVPPDDDRALAMAVAELVGAPEERAAMARAARLRIATAFSVEQSARSLAGHYRAVAENGRQNPDGAPSGTRQVRC
ncbi:MAG TPA: glycosyltransferase family 4 protein [Pirellulales bacterium]|nr:glycosyltransferase family 4 protein [Pirellulales bacterium]